MNQFAEKAPRYACVNMTVTETLGPCEAKRLEVMIRAMFTPFQTHLPCLPAFGHYGLQTVFQGRTRIRRKVKSWAGQQILSGV